MAVTFKVSTDPSDVTIYALAEHTLAEGEEVMCYTTPDGKTRARRVLPGEKAIGEAMHNVMGGLPVTVLVCRKVER